MNCTCNCSQDRLVAAVEYVAQIQLFVLFLLCLALYDVTFNTRQRLAVELGAARALANCYLHRREE